MFNKNYFKGKPITKTKEDIEKLKNIKVSKKSLIPTQDKKNFLEISKRSENNNNIDDLTKSIEEKIRNKFKDDKNINIENKDGCINIYIEDSDDEENNDKIIKESDLPRDEDGNEKNKYVSLSSQAKKIRPQYENKDGKTLQDIMSEDIPSTRLKWEEEDYKEITDKNEMLNLNPKDNLKVRYITNNKKVRMGGKLSSINDKINKDGKELKYLTIRSFAAGFKPFSVQIDNIASLYWKVIDSSDEKLPENDHKVQESLKTFYDKYSLGLKKLPTQKRFWDFINNDENIDNKIKNKITKRHFLYFMRNI